jgi:hypothetical protein
VKGTARPFVEQAFARRPKDQRLRICRDLKQQDSH